MKKLIILHRMCAIMLFSTSLSIKSESLTNTKKREETAHLALDLR